MGVGRCCFRGSEAAEMKSGADSEEQEVEKPGGCSAVGQGWSPLRKLVSQLSGAAQKRETCASLPRLFPKPMNMRCVASAEAVPAVWGCWVESPGSEVSLM